MTRRSVRVTLVCLGVLLTAALSYRVFVDEQQLTSERERVAATDTAIGDVLRTLSDVRASLHAYVAPGQRSSVWEQRTATLFDKLRQQLISLDATADSSGQTLNDSLDNLDQLTAAEKRVQHYLDFSQPLLAGDVIFTEIRDLVDTTGTQVIAVREALRQQAELRITRARRDQAMLLVGGATFWLGLALLLALVPSYQSVHASRVASGAPASESTESLDLALESRTITSSVQETPTVAFVEPPEPVETPQESRWRTLSNICKELTAVKELNLLAGPLSRACQAMGAKDAILWVATPDGLTLTPQVSHGFDPRVLARIGAIPRDSDNLTSAAFRDGKPHVSAATASAPGALAVALRGLSGPVGVLSVELEAETDSAEAVDLATMFAAQMTPLVLSARAAQLETAELRQA